MMRDQVNGARGQSRVPGSRQRGHGEIQSRPWKHTFLFVWRERWHFGPKGLRASCTWKKNTFQCRRPRGKANAGQDPGGRAVPRGPLSKPGPHGCRRARRGDTRELPAALSWGCRTPELRRQLSPESTLPRAPLGPGLWPGARTVLRLARPIHGRSRPCCAKGDTVFRNGLPHWSFKSCSSRWVCVVRNLLLNILCCSITAVPIVAPLLSSPQPTPHSHGPPPPCCPWPGVTHTCSWTRPSPFLLPLPPPPLWSLEVGSLFPNLWFRFAHLFVFLIGFHL